MSATANKTLEETIIDLEHARRAAFMRGDPDEIESFLADTFHYAHISGLIEDREEFMRRTRAGPGGISFTSARDMAVQERPGYALLTGVSRIESKVLTFDAYFLGVWEPKGDTWRLSAYASTPLPKAPGE
jgi:hypothetical protein